mmetsp:Transcript_95873/g.200394  ORF Transcript_95873/g.200394 Transcript_95873/m.200394 type:complete len:762 (-) Transcript_95873:213-2498(-)|eukprot:CAMPEP_0206423334 /NCGR_PEP_ID=MMETSP0324_2-20121206/2625_1 /ASSEMBLY_ACC=CAM_ASM_000836 /TAXON_ID=2866 /ORGANISM="Crypthecodinium cohnii, Strain Seligo" /LENGTH=761 /DNA_ID=CAMNT_0053887887 /DNA_START=121 /DNA_END=2406 /DNA_ORIENTATION=+
MADMADATCDFGGPWLVDWADDLSKMVRLLGASPNYFFAINDDVKARYLSKSIEMRNAVLQSSKGLLDILMETLKTTHSEAEALDVLKVLKYPAKESQAGLDMIRSLLSKDILQRTIDNFSGNKEVMKECTYLVEALWGIEGLTRVFQASLTKPGPLRTEVAWTLWRIANETTSNSEYYIGIDWPEAVPLCTAIMTALGSEDLDAETRLACLRLLEELLSDQQQRAQQFVEVGGGKALFDAMHFATQILMRMATRSSEPNFHEELLLRTGALITKLVGLAPPIRRNLSKLGAEEYLIRCALSLSDPMSLQTILECLGVVSGPKGVLQVLQQAECTLSAVLCCLGQLSWSTEKMDEDLQPQLPDALALMLRLTSHIQTRPVEDLDNYLTCLAGFAQALTPVVRPRQLQQVDKTIEILLDALQNVASAETAVIAGSSVGHISAHCPYWRHWLRTKTVAAEALRARIMDPRSNEEVKFPNQKKYVWALAAVAGINQMFDLLESTQKSFLSGNMQMACLEAIRDHLCQHDDGIDDEVAAKLGVQILLPKEVPHVINVVIRSMDMHLERRNIQVAACQALGLLSSFLPDGVGHAWGVAAEAVIRALRRHNTDYDVVDMAVWALADGFFEPPCNSSESQGRQLVAAAVEYLREQVTGSLPDIVAMALEHNVRSLMTRVFYILIVVASPRKLFDEHLLPPDCPGIRLLYGLQALTKTARIAPGILEDPQYITALQQLAKRKFPDEGESIQESLNEQFNLLSGLLRGRT